MDPFDVILLCFYFNDLVKNIVTGGAGFLGSHLIDQLMKKGEDVICLDNFFTGNKKNYMKLTGINCICAQHAILNEIKNSSSGKKLTILL